MIASMAKLPKKFSMFAFLRKVMPYFTMGLKTIVGEKDKYKIKGKTNKNIKYLILWRFK